MKKKLQFFGLLACMTMSLQLNAQLVYNNGADIILNQDMMVFVYGTVQNEAGQIDVDAVSGQSELLIQDDFINNGIAGGDGYYRVSGDWINNSTFNAGSGTVFLEGNAQTLGGTASTTFNNLTLDGTGVKTQAIDQYCTGILSLNDVELNTDVYGFYVQNTDVNAITLGTGFVSSLNGGFLSRATNTASAYLFPVGSNLGTTRYRPVEITPDGTGNTFTVRMANADATTEGYDVNAFETGICEINPLFYHQINRTSGSSAVDMSIYYDDANDGSWDGISNWSTSPNQWEIITGSSTTSGTPLYEAFTNGWNDFSNIPYALYKVSPPTPTVSTDCSGGEDAGTIEVTAPTGSEYEYSIIDGNYQTSTIFGPLANGSYTVTVMNTTTGCTSAGNEIDLDCGCTNSPTLTLSSSAGETCVSDPVTITANTFDGSATEVYLSHNGSGILDADTISASPFDFTYTPSSGDAGSTVTITVITNNPLSAPCDSAEATFTLTVYPLPYVDAGSNSPVCEGADIDLSESGDEADTWSWSGPDGFTSTDRNPTITNATTAADGTYTVTATDSNGCIAEDNVTVQVITVSPSITENPGSLCYQDDPVDLEASPSGGTWSGTGITDASAGTFDPSVANIGDNIITYEVTESGCTGQTSINILVYEIADATIEDPGAFCSDDDTVALTAGNTGGTWTGDGVDPATGVFDPVDAGSGTHEIIYTISGNCGDADTVYVTVYQRANATIIDPVDSMYIDDPAITLTAEDNGGVWSGNGIDPTSGEFNPEDAGIGDHQIIYTIGGNCGDADSTIIVVSPEQIEDLFIPDVITPNGDDYNETWEIQGIEAYDEITIFIFNRWGDEVFSFSGSGSSYTETQNQWDGEWKNKELPFGTYFYVLELNNNNESYKGTITLIR